MCLQGEGLRTRSRYTGGFRVDLDAIAWERLNIEEPPPSITTFTPVDWITGLRSDLRVIGDIQRRLAQVWIHS